MAVDVFDEFVTEVTTLSNILRKTAARILRENALAPAEIRVLQILDEQGSKTVPEIGRRRLTSRQNIQIMVNRLQRAGMVEFAPNPSHKRSGLVRLTAKGQKSLERVSGGSLSPWAALSDVTDQEITLATGVLRKVREGLARPDLFQKAESRRVVDPTVEPPKDLTNQPPDSHSPAPPAEDELPVSLL